MAEHPSNTKFLAQIRALYPEPEQVLQAAQHVDATIKTPGWELIAQLLEDRMTQRLAEMVRHAPVKSEAEYARDLAEIRGMQWALDAGQTVLDEAEAVRLKLIREQGTTQ